MTINSTSLYQYFFALIFICMILSCKKEEFPTGAYVGQFWGEDPYNNTLYYELDVPLELIASTESSITFNNTIVLQKTKDSIQGTFVFENSDYLIDPYLVGVWRKEKKMYTISGSYAAAKENYVVINGTFEINKKE